jgi:hypothetical protein
MPSTPPDTPPSRRHPSGDDLTVDRRPARAEIRLGPPATTVYETLAARDREVAEWYRGAIMVLRATENPDRFAQAAHSMREVMNEVGRLAGLPQQEEEGRLGEQFRKMKEKFSQAKRRSECHDGNEWSGEIDDNARTALVAVEEVIEWEDENRRARREVFIAARRTLDGSRRELPKAEEDRMWRAWNKTRSYFISVTHHRKEVDEAEFDRQVELLEEFILRMFRGDAYREQRRIAELIEGAERGS